VIKASILKSEFIAHMDYMRRLAPDFINKQLWKLTKKLVPGVA
jgi:hypothetical protein